MWTDLLTFCHLDSSVQKTRDPSKIITPAAYLLFYRRRSEAPLGGPRFQEIFNRFDQGRSPAGANDEDDSGEGQRLGLGSSLRGSPSASTGAGLAHPLGSRGLASSSGLPVSNGGSLLAVDGVGGDDGDLLPSYTASALGQDGGVVEDDEAGMTGLVWTNTDTLRNSIEGDAEDEDEAISLGDVYDETNARNLAGMSSVIGENSWSFQNIDGSPRGVSVADDDSNVAEGGDNSSTMADFADGSDQDMGTGMIRMTSDEGGEPGAGYVLPEEPMPQLVDEEEFEGFEDMPPMREPTDQEKEYMAQLTEQAWDTKAVGGREGGQVLHTVPPVGGVLDGDEDGDSDRVAEIHVGED